MTLLSATQISKWRECPRKWAWQYLLGIKQPQSASAQLGDAVDGGQLQPYLRDGKPLDLTTKAGQVAQPALEHLPAPNTPGIRLQKAFQIPAESWETSGIYFQGYIDLWQPTKPIPGVTDFKTTKNLRYSKTKKDLLTDPQSVLYTVSAVYETGAEFVDLKWLYLRTEGEPKAKPVCVRISAEQAFAEFPKLEATALEIVAAKKAFDADPQGCGPKSLTPNPDMCAEYGGCPYRDKCNLSPKEIIAAKAAKSRKGNLMSVDLLAKVRAQVAAQVPAADPEPALPVWATAEVDPLLQAKGINPPESKLPPAPISELPVTTTTKKKRGRPAKDPLGADVAAAIEAITVVDVAPAPIPTATRRVTAYWGKEVYQPIPFNSFEVGPFEASADVREDETASSVLTRLNDELAKVAASERVRKATVFAEGLSK